MAAVSAVSIEKRAVRFQEDENRRDEGNLQFYENGIQLSKIFVCVKDWKQNFTSEIGKEITNLNGSEWGAFLEKAGDELYILTFEQVKEMIQQVKGQHKIDPTSRPFAKLELLCSAQIDHGAKIDVYEDFGCKLITTPFGEFDVLCDQNDGNLEDAVETMAKMPLGCLSRVVSRMQGEELPTVSDLKNAIVAEVNKEHISRLSDALDQTSVKPPDSDSKSNH